jgi:hypothetical protein
MTFDLFDNTSIYIILTIKSLLHFSCATISRCPRKYQNAEMSVVIANIIAAWQRHGQWLHNLRLSNNNSNTQKTKLYWIMFKPLMKRLNGTTSGESLYFAIYGDMVLRYQNILYFMIFRWMSYNLSFLLTRRKIRNAPFAIFLYHLYSRFRP